jgi:DNA polymerase-3 subunit epsilon
MAQDFLDGERVLALDLETTGISTNNDKIVQIALIGSSEDGSEISYENLINPRRSIPIQASNVHGIFDSDVKNLSDFSTFADEIYEQIEGAVIIGHNVRQFDLPLLNNEFRRLGRLPPNPKVVLDTLEVVRRVKLPRPHNLGALCKKHGISLENAHTAAADAAASLLLFWRLTVDHSPYFRKSLEELERWLVHGDSRKEDSNLGRGLEDLDMLDSLGKIRIDEGHYVLAFGRHKGRHVSEIQNIDPKYISWLLSPKGIEDEVARETLREYLH